MKIINSKYLLLALVVLLSACDSDTNSSKGSINSVKSNPEVLVNTAQLSKVQIPEMSSEDLRAQFIKSGALKLSSGFTTWDFSIDNFPDSITSTYTAGRGRNEWFGQYVAGVLTVKQNNLLCGLHFNSVYNNQFDIIFSDGNCDNTKDGNKCSVPYYSVAHGDMKQEAYNVIVNYHYQTALDGKDCNNGISKVKHSYRVLTFNKKYDSDIHSIFQVDTGVHPLLSPQAQLNAVVGKDSSGNKFFSVGYDYNHLNNSESILIVDDKMTHDIADKVTGPDPSGRKYDSYSCTARTTSYDHEYTISQQLSNACVQKFGDGWRGLSVNFSNPFKDSLVRVYKTNGLNGVKFLNDDKTVSILSGQTKSLDLCVSNELLGDLINHNKAGKVHIGTDAISPHFIYPKKLASFEIVYHIGGNEYTGVATLTSYGQILENNRQVSSPDKFAGYCVANMMETRAPIPSRLENLKTEYSMNLKMDLRMSNDIPIDIYKQRALNFAHPISIANIGVNKVVDKSIYATNVSYYLVDSGNPRKKVDFESWELYNSVAYNESGESTILQFSNLDIAKKWDSGGLATTLNFFTSQVPGAPNKGGFLVVKYDDMSGEQHYQTFPFVVSYNPVYVPNREYNVFNGYPILKDENGKLLKSAEVSIPLATAITLKPSDDQVQLNAVGLLNGITSKDMVATKQDDWPIVSYMSSAMDYIGTKSWNTAFQSDTSKLFTMTSGEWESYLEHLYVKSIYESDAYTVFELPVVDHETGLSLEDDSTYVKILKPRDIKMVSTVSEEVRSLLNKDKSSIHTYLALVTPECGFDNATVNPGESTKIAYLSGYDYQDNFNNPRVEGREIHVGFSDNGKTTDVGILRCKSFDNSCRWEKEPQDMLITTIANESVAVSFKLTKQSKTRFDADSVVEVNYEVYDGKKTPRNTDFAGKTTADGVYYICSADIDLKLSSGSAYYVTLDGVLQQQCAYHVNSCSIDYSKTWKWKGSNQNASFILPLKIDNRSYNLNVLCKPAL